MLMVYLEMSSLFFFFVRRCPVAWASGACWCWVWCWFVRWRCPALSGAGCWFSGGATVWAGVASSNVGQRGGCFFWWFGVFGQYWRYRGRGGGGGLRSPVATFGVALVVGLVAPIEQVGCAGGLVAGRCGPSGGVVVRLQCFFSGCLNSWWSRCILHWCRAVRVGQS